jgi:hypothetical protein
MLSMMSQADSNVSWKRTILDPVCSSSRQPSSLRAPTSDCLTCFHMVVAIMTFFLTSPHRMSNNTLFFCGEPTLRLSEIRCKYTIPAIVETLYLYFEHYFTTCGTTWLRPHLFRNQLVIFVKLLTSSFVSSKPGVSTKTTG